MKNLAEIIYTNDKGTPVVSSLDMSVQFERAHPDVIKSLKSLMKTGHLAKGDISFCGRINELENGLGKTRKYKYYELTERGFLIACPFIGGVKARDGQVRLVDEFMHMKDFISWTGHREGLSRGYDPLMQAFAAHCKANGWGDPEPLARAREGNLVNRAVLGLGATEYKHKHQCSEVRGHVSEKELQLMNECQSMAIKLLNKGLDFTTRRDILFALYVGDLK